MGLFDRLLGTRSSSSVKVSGQAKPAKPAQEKPEAFFLDPDASTSLGDVTFMRRSNTIRHTFPGNADSPGQKEMVQEVGSMEARLEKQTPGLAGQAETADRDVSLTGGVPKAVRKTFAQQMSAAELEQRLKGSALSGANVPGASANQKKKDAQQSQPASSSQGVKPGATDPFKAMAKDLNA